MSPLVCSALPVRPTERRMLHCGLGSPIRQLWACRWADENGDWLRNSLYHRSAATTIRCGACPRFHYILRPACRWGGEISKPSFLLAEVDLKSHFILAELPLLVHRHYLPARRPND
jgi:hypothetical protein